MLERETLTVIMTCLAYWAILFSHILSQVIDMTPTYLSTTNFSIGNTTFCGNIRRNTSFILPMTFILPDLFLYALTLFHTLFYLKSVDADLIRIRQNTTLKQIIVILIQVLILNWQ